jgi:hypothetical protein
MVAIAGAIISQRTGQAATVSDATAIAEIYNQGIADRVAIFETEPRSPAQIAEWFSGGILIVVAETRNGLGPLRFGVRNADRALWPGGARADYRDHADCRLREHLVWAALHLLVGLPLNRLLMPRAPPPTRTAETPAGAAPAPRGAMPILAFVFAAT